MNQEKIGKFIAECRKEKNLTQLQLAEKLNISNRAVSKWETGKSSPDVSIMMELCDILGINVNELLSGERIIMENYPKKAEQNLVELQKQKEQANKMKRKLEILWGVIAIILFPVHLAINYFYPENQGTYIGWGILIIGALLFVASVYRGQHASAHVISRVFSVIFNRRTSLYASFIFLENP